VSNVETLRCPSRSASDGGLRQNVGARRCVRTRGQQGRQVGGGGGESRRARSHVELRVPSSRGSRSPPSSPRGASGRDAAPRVMACSGVGASWHAPSSTVQSVEQFVQYAASIGYRDGSGRVTAAGRVVQRTSSGRLSDVQAGSAEPGDHAGTSGRSCTGTTRPPGNTGCGFFFFFQKSHCAAGCGTRGPVQERPDLGQMAACPGSDPGPEPVIAVLRG